MPVGGRKQYPAPIEHDVAVVESTISGRSWELPAMWNRMFEQRVIWDYDTAGFEKIGALPGETFAHVGRGQRLCQRSLHPLDHGSRGALRRDETCPAVEVVAVAGGEPRPGEDAGEDLAHLPWRTPVRAV